MFCYNILYSYIMYNNGYYLLIQYIGHLVTMRLSQHKILMIEARDGQYQKIMSRYIMRVISL